MKSLRSPILTAPENIAARLPKVGNSAGFHSGLMGDGSARSDNAQCAAILILRNAAAASGERAQRNRLLRF